MERDKDKNKIPPNGQVFKLDEITVRNPATDQILTCTEKLYYSIYRDKGFEIVDRDNAEKGVAAGSGVTSKRSNGEKRRLESASEVGSAAEIASKIGIDDSPANNDEDEGGKNANTIDLASASDSKSGPKGDGDRGRSK